jgi:hypothetical protein
MQKFVNAVKFVVCGFLVVMAALSAESSEYAQAVADLICALVIYATAPDVN